MHTDQETVLATIPGATDQHRLLVVLCHAATEGSAIQLRQQSWGDGLGWYTQNSMAIEPQQLTQLRAALGSGGDTAHASRSWQADFASGKATARRTDGPSLRLVHADSA